MKNIRLVATGDSLITMKQSVHSEPQFLDMVSLIRSADIAFTNHEMLLHDYGANENGVWPSAESGGTYTRAPPHIIDELMWMGFSIFSTANNHSLDYLYGGLLSTRDYLDLAGVLHSGTGKDLAEARAPAYAEYPQGRVALVSASSTFASFGRAGDARRDLSGRPGLNPLRFKTWWTVKEESLEAIKELELELGISGLVQPDGAHIFLRQKFVVGDDVGMHTKPHAEDMAGNLESIGDAARMADWVLFSLHAHEGLPHDLEQPAEFIETFAREVIDAGAHAFIGHGHHAMRGIEVRDGKPIFYGLGDFIFQNETVFKMPADFYERYKLDPYKGTPSKAYDARQNAPQRPGWPASKWFTKDRKYWVSVIPFMEFEGDRLNSLTLHPVELGQDKSRSQRGRPMFVDNEEGAEIVGIIKKLSEPYGTDINIENGIGIVKV
ncbi:MAG: CapA family protein [Candidatus Bathyarchaeota archaeon]|nr:CapA family protein [Candidatus Bathyarchaeota archaeon]